MGRFFRYLSSSENLRCTAVSCIVGSAICLVLCTIVDMVADK